jgi:hypothetical protein
MQIFIDEAGRFTPGDGISLVCGLAIPHKAVGQCRRELTRISKDWPHRNGELKSADLKPTHIESLVEVLCRHDALLHAVAADVSKHTTEEVALHQACQAEGITRHLTDSHKPSLVKEVWTLRKALEGMPPQLYFQCVAMHQLIWIVAEETAMYFAQRRPTELSKFEWFVDAKDPARVTTQEKWWRDVIGPLGDSRGRREGFATVHDEGFDYSHFDRAFSREADLWYPDGPRRKIQGIDINKLIAQRIFRRFQVITFDPGVRYLVRNDAAVTPK